jgi:hypothetical protein
MHGRTIAGEEPTDNRQESKTASSGCKAGDDRKMSASRRSGAAPAFRSCGPGRPPGEAAALASYSEGGRESQIYRFQRHRALVARNEGRSCPLGQFQDWSAALGVDPSKALAEGHRRMVIYWQMPHLTYSLPPSGFVPALRAAI